ncbi:MAG: HlyC/CorC family transporter [Chitinophagaceae bacterium]|nr:HlyC/CorC family transporter [Chitinophagaceae bacterium]
MEYLIILFLTIFNGLFAMAEVALISSRKIRLEKLAKQGNWRAKLAYNLAKDPHRFLPTVQIGMTAVSIIAGAYGGTEVADRLSSDFSQIEWLGEYANILGFVVTIVTTTFLTLVLGELVPKTIGMTRPESIAIALAPIMQFLYYIASPFIWLLSISTKFILKLLRLNKKSNEPPVTEDELKHLIEQGRQYGVLEQQESDMMRSIFRTADRNVSTLMTHRNDIIWIDSEASIEDIRKLIEQSVHTNFPVCKQNLDHIIGIASIKDILIQISKQQPWNLLTLIKQPLYVPESMPALELLESFRNTGNHVSLVLNEYGSFEGIVTLHDVVESIFGNIRVTNQQTQDEAVKRTDGSWLMEGMMQTHDWSELLHIHDLTEEEAGNYNTLGGFMMHHLGKIPKEADSFTFRNYIFEIVDMDGRRVDKVLVRKTEN